jgi:hypothetical protein
MGGKKVVPAINASFDKGLSFIDHRKSAGSDVGRELI